MSDVILSAAEKYPEITLEAIKKAGSISALERNTGVNRNTLKAWSLGKHEPTLSLFYNVLRFLER